MAVYGSTGHVILPPDPAVQPMPDLLLQIADLSRSVENDETIRLLLG
jgi:hypothetical protein